MFQETSFVFVPFNCCCLLALLSYIAVTSLKDSRQSMYLCFDKVTRFYYYVNVNVNNNLKVDNNI